MKSPDPRRKLLDLAEQRGVSLARLSDLIGRNTSYLQQFVRKGSPRKLEETDRRTLAGFFGIDESQLGAPEENSSNRAGKAWRGDWFDIPRLALGASAGPGTLAGEEQAIGAFRFAARWLGAAQQRSLDIRIVDVANRDDVLVEHLHHVAHAHAADPDARDVQLRTRRAVAGATQHETRNDHGTECELRRVTDEVAP